MKFKYAFLVAIALSAVAGVFSLSTRFMGTEYPLTKITIQTRQEFDSMPCDYFERTRVRSAPHVLFYYQDEAGKSVEANAGLNDVSIKINPDSTAPSGKMAGMTDAGHVVWQLTMPQSVYEQNKNCLRLITIRNK